MKNFEWDSNKKDSNYRKHGVDFLEAIKVFDDPNRDEETRFQTVGIADEHVIMVIYTIRNEFKRIIFARRANQNERKYYYRERC